MIDGDQDLRDRFTALRIEEKMRAPEFGNVLRPTHVRDDSKSAGRLIAATALLAATVATALWFRPAFHSLHREADKHVVSIAEWKSPTAFLLDTPGRDLLQTVPSVGVWHEYEFAPRARQKHRHIRTQLLP